MAFLDPVVFGASPISMDTLFAIDIAEIRRGYFSVLVQVTISCMSPIYLCTNDQPAL